MRSFLLLALLLCSVWSNQVEKKFIKAGLVDVQSVDSTIEVNLVNSARRKNIFKEDLYDGLEKAYLRKEVALKLKKAQEILKRHNPDYSLCVLDAARPRSISWKMYNKLKDTKFKKFVANPRKGSMHNYGIAVDLTIVDKGKRLDMGITPFFKSNLQIKLSYLMKKLGKKPTKKQARNRALLTSVMKEAGFYPLSFEWWHFNGLKKSIARKRYKIIE